MQPTKAQQDLVEKLTDTYGIARVYTTGDSIVQCKAADNFMSSSTTAVLSDIEHDFSIGTDMDDRIVITFMDVE